MNLQSHRLPMPACIKDILPEWRALAAKIETGIISEVELNRLDELNQFITAQAKKAVN